MWAYGKGTGGLIWLVVYSCFLIYEGVVGWIKKQVAKL